MSQLPGTVTAPVRDSLIQQHQAVNTVFKVCGSQDLSANVHKDTHNTQLPKALTRHEAQVHVVLREVEVGHALMVQPPIPADRDVVTCLKHVQAKEVC